MPEQLQCKLEVLDNRENTGHIKVTGVLNFDTVLSLNRKMQILLEKCNDILVDLSGVTYVNSAGLALLLDWKRQTLCTNKNLQLLNMPQKLINIARMCDIDNLLLQNDSGIQLSDS